MFSVVIPLYNKQDSIEGTLKSVLEQSFTEFEVVVVNDGSTDGSLDIVKNVDDKRLRVINQENSGVSSARNRGVAAAVYEWIAFLDGDDLWEPYHLEEVYKMMRKFPSEMVYATSFSYSDNRPTFRYNRAEQISKIENYFLESRKEILISTIVVVIARVALKKVGMFDERLTRGEDADLWMRLARKYPVVKSTKITALYRVDAENRTSISKELEKTHVYYLDLSNASDPDERSYYKFVLHSRLYAYLRLGYFKAFHRLNKRFPEVGMGSFILFVMGKLVRQRNR